MTLRSRQAKIYHKCFDLHKEKENEEVEEEGKKDNKWRFTTHYFAVTILWAK